MDFAVCVVDDSADENTILRQGLQMHGYHAMAAHSGQEALDVCQASLPDLILLDVGLPDMDGYAVCEQLKKSPETRDIPIIFVTARGENEDVARGYTLGAVDYVTKPYNLPMVMIRVDSALRTKQTDTFSRASSLEDTAYTDPLTGLRNQRFLSERLEEELEKAHRYNMPVSCLFLDVSDVEAVDSELGSAAMDDLLAEIAMIMRNSSRVYDVLARFDGGLFAAVLPHTSLRAALRYAQKIQREVEDTTFSDPSFPTRAHLSFGIVTCANGQAQGAQRIMGEAMRNLLHAAAGCERGIVARDLNQGA